MGKEVQAQAQGWLDVWKPRLGFISHIWGALRCSQRSGRKFPQAWTRLPQARAWWWWSSRNRILLLSDELPHEFIGGKSSWLSVHSQSRDTGSISPLSRMAFRPVQETCYPATIATIPFRIVVLVQEQNSQDELKIINDRVVIMSSFVYDQTYITIKGYWIRKCEFMLSPSSIRRKSISEIFKFTAH